MTQSRHSPPSPAPGTRPPEYIVEIWVNPELEDRLRPLAGTLKDQAQPQRQPEARQPELEAGS